ncbi:MAG TPA: glucose-1-phosphate adenylyltransferase, partial [bacterium]|nr:glucose-1-phosphate adenylyltransferase [bacterium]
PYEEAGYWRDVGTIPAYWHAHMDLLGPEPRLDLDNDRWPILTAPFRGPSTRIILGDVSDSILGEGALVDGATIRRSIIGRGVRVGRGASVEDSIIMERTTIATGAHVRRAVIDRYNAIPEGERIGEDGEIDRRRFHVDPSGLVVVPRGQTR